MIPYLPHSPEDRREMLETIGVGSVDELFKDIPPDIRFNGELNLPGHLSEFEVYRRIVGLAEENSTCVSFLGGGVYDHIIPSVVPFVTSRPEFLTAYTPYQAEMSQGVLQAIFEYQTLMCELTALDVSNASLYDGATAAAEACAMAVNSVRGAHTILYSSTIHPSTVEVLHTFFSKIDVELQEVKAAGGALQLDTLERYLEPGVAGVLVQSPNRYGCIEDYTGFAAKIHDCGGLFIMSANPLSLGMLKAPGDWEADMAVGDGQVLGLPQNFGGPGVGYICATTKLMRKMPGRIVGESVDAEGRRAFVLTLQAREQHIKRERATSNICTNQALAALGVAAYLVSVGPEGLYEAARQNHYKARYLYDRITAETAAGATFEAPFFNEFALTLPISSREVIDRLVGEGFFAGIPLDGPYGLGENQILVSVTEKRTRAEIDGFVEALKKVIG